MESMDRTPEKIFVGTFEIARHLYDLAEAFRTLGHEVETGLAFFNPQHPELSYDHRLDHRTLLSVLQSLEQKPIETLLALPPELLFIRRLLTEFDVYVFQWGHSLLPNNQDLPILRALGKRIICIFNGSDLRHYSAADPFWEELGMTPRACPRELQHGKSQLSAYLHRLRMAEHHADVLYAQPSYAQLAVRPYRHLWLPMNLSLYPHRIPGREIPIVVHAPSNAQVKGTDRILQATERLREDGVAFELRLLQGVTNEEVVRNLAEADVVIDQLRSMHYGMLALEGMATGCAVAGSIVRDAVPLPSILPVQHVDDENVYASLKQLLTDRSHRLRLAESGRKFAARHHDHIGVARDLLRSARAGTRQASDYYPTYYSCRYRVPDEETVVASVQDMTARIVAEWGLPEEADPGRMVEEGLIAPSVLEKETAIPRWHEPPVTTRRTFWGWCLPEAEARPELDAEALLAVVEAAVRAASAGRFADTDRLLQACIEQAEASPALLDDALVARALGELAEELGEPELQHALAARRAPAGI